MDGRDSLVEASAHSSTVDFLKLLGNTGTEAHNFESYDENHKFVEKLNELSASESYQLEREIQVFIAGHRIGDVYAIPTETQWQ